ncbi:S1C family serine protease [Galbitalea soli]|uniref:PDZ domain-containing protein n=1 Tax=Galbitalea soli TaxID=1268042 RepID=A0A7C9TQE0_9MICO|nr:trypsin-like peptidase domain-containing protein [Galbitalea soli]NEM90564.1 PDZ domain-containing protein [Galbitalea soli]NYJ31279.1 putative serine protease PepD [Galbitalea soli]
MTDAPQEPTPTPSYYSAAPPTATAETENLTPVTPSPKKRAGVGTVIAVAAVAALVGGAVGGGVGIAAFRAAEPTTTSSNSNPASITVNDAKNATTITAVAAKASPSVVTISVTGTSAAGTGSGIILSSDGYVLTNTHVVTLDGEVATAKIQVETNDGRLYSATLVGTDPTDDLAVIKLQNVSGLQPAEFADSSKLNVGDSAIAIGAPLGLAGTVTNGIVSALNRSITVASSAAPTTPDDSTNGGGSGSNGQNGPFDFWNFDMPGQGNTQTQGSATSTISLSVIQTDAAINPGNSGGALLDSDGKVIGVNVAIASASDSSTTGSQSGSIGVGFAIPSNAAKRIADEIIKNGKATHGLLGASVADANNSTTSGSATTVGALIESVVSGGAASNAGLRKGDVITNFNGIPITSATDLTAQVRVLPGGAKATVTYVRSGTASKVDVTLGTLK